jgi:cyclin C
LQVGAWDRTELMAEYHIKTFPAEHHRLGEMEFYLLEDLDFHLIVFHPYRSLVAICGREPADSGIFLPVETTDDSVERIKRVNGRGSGEGVMEIEEGVLQVAW